MEGIEFRADKHDTKLEMNKLADLVENDQLDTVISNQEFKKYVNIDKRISNESYLSVYSKDYKKIISDTIKTQKPDLFNKLKDARLVKVDANGNINEQWKRKNWSGPQWVKFLQILLNEAKHLNPPLAVDGAFWMNTFKELIKYQKDDNNALKPDGVAGKRTISKLIYDVLHWNSNTENSNTESSNTESSNTENSNTENSNQQQSSENWNTDVHSGWWQASLITDEGFYRYLQNRHQTQDNDRWRYYYYRNQHRR